MEKAGGGGGGEEMPAGTVWVWVGVGEEVCVCDKLKFVKETTEGSPVTKRTDR